MQPHGRYQQQHESASIAARPRGHETHPWNIRGIVPLEMVRIGQQEIIVKAFRMVQCSTVGGDSARVAIERKIIGLQMRFGDVIQKREYRKEQYSENVQCSGMLVTEVSDPICNSQEATTTRRFRDVQVHRHRSPVVRLSFRRAFWLSTGAALFAEPRRKRQSALCQGPYAHGHDTDERQGEPILFEAIPSQPTRRPSRIGQ